MQLLLFPVSIEFRFALRLDTPLTPGSSLLLVSSFHSLSRSKNALNGSHISACLESGITSSGVFFLGRLLHDPWVHQLIRAFVDRQLKKLKYWHNDGLQGTSGKLGAASTSLVVLIRALGVQMLCFWLRLFSGQDGWQIFRSLCTISKVPDSVAGELCWYCRGGSCFCIT